MAKKKGTAGKRADRPRGKSFLKDQRVDLYEDQLDDIKERGFHLGGFLRKATDFYLDHLDAADRRLEIATGNGDDDEEEEEDDSA